MIMYCIYNSDTLEQFIDTVHKMHNKTTWNEKLFSHTLNHLYISKDGVGHYAINSLMFLTMTKEKYVKMYETFINQL